MSSDIMLASEFLDLYSTDETREAMQKDLYKVVNDKNLSTSIESLMPFGQHVIQRLAKNGIHTIGDLSTLTKEKFMLYGYVGRCKIKKTEEIMEKFGVRFLVK